MENKNLKVIMGLGLVIILTIIVLLVIFIKPKAPSQQDLLAPSEAPSTLEYEKNKTRNIIGRIISIETNKIEVITSDGQKLTLKILPVKGASFVNQTLQNDGSFLNEGIGLFDLPKDRDVRIQYDGRDDSVRLIEVR